MHLNIDDWRSFYAGRIYPVLVALLVLLGNATGFDVVFAILILLSMVPACFICHDLRFALMPVMSTVFIVSGKTYTPGNPGYAERYLKPSVLISIGITAVLVIVALTGFVIKNRKTANRLPRRMTLVSLLIFCAALFCNGAFAEGYTPLNLFFAFMISLSLLLVYILFALFLDIDRQVFDRFMYCLVILGLLICFELLAAYCTTVQFVDGAIVKGSVVLGWGAWTNIGGMLVFLLPAHFYFAASHRYGIWAIVSGMLQFVCIFLSQSRGALLMGGVMLLLCLVYLFFKGKNRRINRIVILSLIGIGLIGSALLFEKISGLIQNFLNMGFGDNGRFALWRAGLENFSEYPIFGSGFYDCYVPEAHAGWKMDVYPYLYHCTIVQLLASSGIVGFVAYTYHRFCTIKSICRHPNLQKTFFGFCILGLLIFSLTDVLFFKTYPTIIYALILLMIDRRNELKEEPSYI